MKSNEYIEVTLVDASTHDLLMEKFRYDKHRSMNVGENVGVTEVDHTTYYRIVGKLCRTNRMRELNDQMARAADLILYVQSLELSFEHSNT